MKKCAHVKDYVICIGWTTPQQQQNRTYKYKHIILQLVSQGKWVVFSAPFPHTLLEKGEKRANGMSIIIKSSAKGQTTESHG